MDSFKNCIYDAARYGKLDCLKVLFYMKSKVEVSEMLSPCASGATALLAACENGHLEIVQYLIKKCRADVDEVGVVAIDGVKVEGVTPLWCAAAAGHLSIVKLLIKHKALINSTTHTNSTPLRAACYEGNFEIVKYLIEKGADINFVNSLGQTCLMAACYKGHFDIFTHLIKCGVKVDAQDLYGTSALKICVMLGKVEMAKRLIQLGANVKVSGCSENLSRLIYPCIDSTTPLLMACKNGESEIVEYLIQKCCADVEEVGMVTFKDENIESVPPLWCAAAAGHLSIVKILIDHKASVNSSTSTKSTPLRVACYFGHFEIVKYLILNGADIDAANIQGSTSLMIALFHKHNEIYKYLVECGVNVNIQDEFGNAALHVCVEMENLEFTKCLFKHGANIEAANCCGETCLIIACQKGYNEISRYLLKSGANVNRKTLEGNTALHAYSISNDLEMVALLCEKGAKLYENSSGTTPLLAAASKGHKLIVDFFINNYKITKLEQINALELLGAANVDETGHMNTALVYWQQAMALRYENNNIPVEKCLTNSPLTLYLDTNEVHTISQLEALNAVDSNELKKQSLLVRERILGDNHPDTIRYIRNMGVIYGHANLKKCIQLWMYALEVEQRDEEPLSMKTHVIFRILTELFSCKLTEILEERLIVILFQSLLHVFKRILNEIERSFLMPRQNEEHSSTFSKTINMAVHHVGLLGKLLPHLSESEITELKRAVYQFVCLKPSIINGFTPLHLACIEQPSYDTLFPIISFPSLEIIDLLLEVGADPNTIDENHNTPFHLAAMNASCSVEILDSFLKHGAHLDNRNLDNMMPLELTNITSSISIYPLRHLSLKCFCAEIINTYKIPYKGICPKTVEEFLYVHCTH